MSLRELLPEGRELGPERVCLPGVQSGVDVVHEVHDPGFARARRGAARDDLRRDGLDVARLGGCQQLEFPGNLACGHGVRVLRRRRELRPVQRQPARAERAAAGLQESPARCVVLVHVLFPPRVVPPAKYGPGPPAQVNENSRAAPGSGGPGSVTHGAV